MTFVLDTGVLGRLCHPSEAQANPLASRLVALLEEEGAAHRIDLPEIADYELRRKLLHLVKTKKASSQSIAALDELAATLDYLPIETSMMRRAAELWAGARAAGQPTAGPDSLDADVILAAQALAVDGTIVTENARHLGRYAPVTVWS